MKKGFTLIELLVVVLIIGILSAIAIPTYQRVVQRANMARVQTVLDFYMKAVDVYLLENGYPGQYNPVYFDKDGGVSSTYSSSYMNGGSFSVSCTYFCRISFSAKEENSSTIAWSIELIKKEETAGWYPQFNHSSNIGRETDNIPIMCEWLKNNTRFNQSMVDARCASFHLGSGY